MMESLLNDFDRPEPPSKLSMPQQALWWIRKGDFRVGHEWNKAHDICQCAEGTKACDWIHALVHLIEGDYYNASYWYRRAGEAQKSADPQEEWLRIAERLSGGEPAGKQYL